MKILDWRCACGSDDIMAVTAGRDGERRGAVDLFTRANPLIERPVADVYRCAPCWTRVLGR